MLSKVNMGYMCLPQWCHWEWLSFGLEWFWIRRNQAWALPRDANHLWYLHALLHLLLPIPLLSFLLSFFVFQHFLLSFPKLLKYDSTVFHYQLKCGWQLHLEWCGDVLESQVSQDAEVHNWLVPAQCHYLIILCSKSVSSDHSLFLANSVQKPILSALPL